MTFLRRLRLNVAIAVALTLLALTHPRLVFDCMAIVFGWR